MIDTISDSLTSIAFPTGPQTEAPPPPVLVPAPGWRRFVAGLIDGVAVGGVAAGSTLLLQPYLRDDTDPFYAIAILGIFVVNIVLPGLYFVVFLAVASATPGKMALGIRVVGEKGEEKISFGRACLRELVGKPISILILGIGYLMPLWDKKSQALHDKISHTLVVVAK